MKKLIIMMSLLGVLLLGGCSHGLSREDTGMLTGGVIGGVAGSALTHGSTAGTVVGAVGGGYIGRELSR